MLLVVPLALTVGCADDSMSPTEPAFEVPAQFASTANRGTNGALGVVYVSSQGLYYDTFVTVTDLPQKGRFQRLYGGVTEWGPGQQGYVGGRWWVDANNNHIMDEGDAYVLCPLAGRSSCRGWESPAGGCAAPRWSPLALARSGSNRCSLPGDFESVFPR
jgi:hypothetical protein